jgi:serine/threonine-protein kinase HipA
LIIVRKLDVYLRELKIGVLEQDANASLSFTYNDDYRQSESAQAISVSMPLSAEPYSSAVAKPYFSGLLPDESARRRLAAALGISDTNAFGMLEIIGGECAGALALFPQGHEMHEPESADEILNDQQLAELLTELRGNPLLGGRGDIRLSLAGAQDKLAIKVIDGKIALVKNGEPTTHILKPSIQGLAGTAQNETFCMTLASRVGLSAPEVQYAKAGETEFILVKRFDRRVSGKGVVERLHQEDFCQALSVPPELKYEDEGGPGIAKSLELIQRVVDQPARDRLAFLRMQIFHYLVGNADAHAKNFALLYSLDARAPSLAPVYDVVCTASYPELTKRIAMKIGGRNLPDTIHLQHWLSILPDTKASQKLLTKELTLIAKKTLAEAEKLHAEAQQLGFLHPVLRDILRIIKNRATQIQTLAS